MKFIIWTAKHLGLTWIADKISTQYLKRKLGWKIPALALLAMLYLIGFLYLEGWWTKQIFISKIEIHWVKKAEAKEPEAYNITEIVNKVHMLESSGGKRDGCLAKDKINGYGYAQHGSGKVWTCFNTHEEVRTLVEKWFTTKLETMTLSEALCYYNTGHRVQDCDYYQNYLSL